MQNRTIGIYEMVTDDPNTGAPQNPGYAAADIASTMKAFGGGLTVPTPVDVAVDGQNNAGVSDDERDDYSTHNGGGPLVAPRAIRRGLLHGRRQPKYYPCAPADDPSLIKRSRSHA